MDDIGLENSDESLELSKFDPKVTPSPTLSSCEQLLLSLFRQLPELEQQRLMEALDANQRGEVCRQNDRKHKYLVFQRPVTTYVF